MQEGRLSGEKREGERDKDTQIETETHRER